MTQEWRNVGAREGRYTSGNFLSGHAAMPCRSLPGAVFSRRPYRCLLLAALVPAVGAHAFTGPDPFSTEAMTPPPARLNLPERPDFVPCQSPAADTVYDVLEVVDLALCRNPKTRQAWATARVQAAQVGSALGDYLPNLDGKAVSNRVQIDGDRRGTMRQENAALTLSWLLYDFGARSANLENARQLLAAASHSLDATVQSVFLAALQSYYNAQATRAAVSAATESEKASRESLTAAETRYRVGTATPADRLQAQTAWSQATLARIRAEGAHQTALGTLANVIGLDAGQPLRLAETAPPRLDPGFERNIEALIEQARARRPDLKAAEAQYQAARANIDAARADGLPKLSLGAGPTWQNLDGAHTHGNSVGLTLTLPIFSGFATTYAVRKAEAQAEAVSAQREDLRLQVALDVWTAYQNLTTATQTVRTTADLLASAEQSERVALGRYKAGVGNILDVLNAQSALASARLQRIQSLLDWHVSRATLARAVGALDNRLLLPPGERPAP